MRFLWFTAGFLLGVVTTTLGLLWMMDIDPPLEVVSGQTGDEGGV